jgi:hypothetical protein
MNASKALLSAKGVPFDEHHGVRAHNMPERTRSFKLAAAHFAKQQLSQKRKKKS